MHMKWPANCKQIPNNALGRLLCEVKFGNS